MALVGKKAPYFKAKAVINGDDIIDDFSLDQFLGKKYVVFFFYPLDFTFVCPTEIIAFQKRLKDFESRETAVVACSVDSHFSHWAWLQTPQKNGGVQGVTYPIVADLSKTISENYGVLAGYYDIDDEGHSTFVGTPQAYRGLFLIDKEGIVRHEVVNDFPLGRNVDEALRMVDALRHFEDKGEVCPANWEEGEEAMRESHDSVSSYLGKREEQHA